MKNLLVRIIMWCGHLLYKKYQHDAVLYIAGVGKDYPKYLLYTENENVYSRMDRF